MSGTYSVKPTMGGVTVTVQHRETTSRRSAVPTEQDKTVDAAAAEGDAAHHEPPPHMATMSGSAHDVVLDAESREVIYQATEWARREAREGPPAAAARKLKAYERPANPSADPDDPHADIEV
jgi:hypothetical protein